MGSWHPVGPDPYHFVIVSLRPQRDGRLPRGAVVEVDTVRPMAPSRFELESLSDGLGFRGLVEEHALMSARNSTWSGYSLAAADDAGKGSSPGTRSASMVFPTPGGPWKSM
jgi:hypothetical protein